MNASFDLKKIHPILDELGALPGALLPIAAEPIRREYSELRSSRRIDWATASATCCARGADGGAAWFEVALAFGSGLTTVEARFTNTFKAVAAAGLRWNVTAEVEVRNA